MLTFHICEYHLREMESVLLKHGFPDLQTVAFPARCGQPPVNWSEVRSIEQENNAQVVFGSHCLSELADSSTPNPNCRLVKKNQCFEFFIPRFLVNQLQNDGGYLLTPGWLEQWEKIIDQWGFDRKTAVEFFNPYIKRLILLDTGIRNDNSVMMDTLARYLKKPYDIVSIDLDYFELIVENIVIRQNLNETIFSKSEAEKQMANYALIQDTLTRLIKKDTEQKIIASLKDLITALMAPEKICYLPFMDSRPVIMDWDPLGTPEWNKIMNFIENPENQTATGNNRNGLYLKIIGGTGLIGLMEVKEVAFPRHLSQYLNITGNLSGIFGLAIERIRSVEKLITTSHMAGKAEVATEILHNVGNILNSVNISAEQVMEILSNNSVRHITSVSNLINQKKDDLGTYLTSDPKGLKLHLYLEKLSAQIKKEQEIMFSEISSQKKKIQLISEIIRSQQAYSKDTIFTDEIDPQALIQETILLNHRRIKKGNVTLIKNFQKTPALFSQRSKILQILTNIMLNALDALELSDQTDKKIRIRIYSCKDGMIRFEIQDNGVGIPEKVQSQIFMHGFTTRKKGHGFGLHNAANLAAELSGFLEMQSEGNGKGCIFTLTVPTGKKIKSRSKTI